MKLSVVQEVYSSLLEYLYKIGVAEAMTISGIRLVEPAIELNIDNPTSPNKMLNGILGILIGLIFGFGLAFLLDYMDDTIRTSDDTKNQGLVLLGTIPRFRRKESALISLRDPKDIVTESYRTIRNSIKFASLDKPINSLLVTSSIENEGKTVTVVNLGISITHEGKKVLLVDADFRKPAMHKIFGLANSIGITNILAEEAKPGDAIKETDIEGLSLLLSGPIPPDPGGIVESEKMRRLIEDLGQQYDITILDSPPILVINDVMVLARYVDGAIITLEAGKITRRALSQARELLKQANIQVVGAILNKLRIERGGYYYSYQYKSSYYKDQGK
jgi:succinoglycan biosynthesis transport protein ExoP